MSLVVCLSCPVADVELQDGFLQEFSDSGSDSGVSGMYYVSVCLSCLVADVELQDGFLQEFSDSSSDSGVSGMYYVSVCLSVCHV